MERRTTSRGVKKQPISSMQKNDKGGSSDDSSSSKSSSEKGEGCSKSSKRTTDHSKKSRKGGNSTYEKKRKHRPKAIIWKGEKKQKVLVDAIVGHRKCKRVLEKECRFDTRLITKWRQAMDGRLYFEPGEYEMKLGDEQYKVALGPKLSHSKWLFEEELRNCDKMIEEFENKWREESQEAELAKAMKEEERAREDAREEEEHRRVREELIANRVIPRGESPPRSPSPTSEISYTSDEDEEAKRAKYEKTASDETIEENSRRRKKRNEEYQRLMRARLQMVFGTKEEEDAFVGEPTEEQLEHAAFQFYKRSEREREKAKGTKGRTTKKDAEMRETFEEYKKIFMILAREEWDERKGLIISRRRTFDRAKQFGLKYEDDNGNFFRYVYDLKNEIRYQEYEDDELNRLYRRETHFEVDELKRMKKMEEEGGKMDEKETMATRQESPSQTEDDDEIQFLGTTKNHKKSPSSVRPRSPRIERSNEVVDCFDDGPSTSTGKRAPYRR